MRRKWSVCDAFRLLRHSVLPRRFFLNAERAEIGIDTTHMPPNIAWHPDSSSATVAGSISYRRGRMTIFYHVVVTVVLNIFVVLILRWNAKVIFQDLELPEIPVMEIVGLTACGLIFIALGLFFIYRAVRILTNRIQIHLSPSGIDCTEKYCHIERAYHFAIDDDLRIERYVAFIGRNREFDSLAIKSGKTVFPFGALSPCGLRWLESTLRTYIDAHKPNAIGKDGDATD